MQTPDYIVFFIYFIIVSAYGLYVYNRKKHEDSKDYFLAKDSLPLIFPLNSLSG